MELLDLSPSEVLDMSERAHSRFPASGAERWHACAYSAEHEEEFPKSADSFWSKEGTLAHSVLEAMLLGNALPDHFDVSEEMIMHCQNVAVAIRAKHKARGGLLLVEKRVFASYLHEEMFGTCDVIIVPDRRKDESRTLYIDDFKYGRSEVDATRNKQLIQYALSVAESYDWDFDNVQMTIWQPRLSGRDWFNSWTITIDQLKSYVPMWLDAVARVEKGGNVPQPGSHCHWCRGRQVQAGKLSCPAKEEHRAKKVSNMFKQNPITKEVSSGVKKESGQATDEKSFAEKKAWLKEAFKKGGVKIKTGKVEIQTQDIFGEEIEDEAQGYKCEGCGARAGDNCQCIGDFY